MDLVGKHLDVFLISETKIDDSFPESQFLYKGFCKPPSPPPPPLGKTGQ